eukprot:scaffold3180_cov399-Prasinococcus_capsulatus_cf.AAC.8
MPPPLGQRVHSARNGGDHPTLLKMILFMAVVSPMTIVLRIVHKSGLENLSKPQLVDGHIEHAWFGQSLDTGVRGDFRGLPRKRTQRVNEVPTLDAVLDFPRAATRDVCEVQQWVEYMRFSGVAHIWAYGSSDSGETQGREALAPYIDSGFVTYLDALTDSSPEASYADAIRKTKAEWMIFAGQYGRVPFCPPPLRPWALPEAGAGRPAAVRVAGELAAACGRSESWSGAFLPTARATSLRRRFTSTVTPTRSLEAGFPCRVRAACPRPFISRRVWPCAWRQIQMESYSFIGAPQGHAGALLRQLQRRSIHRAHPLGKPISRVSCIEEIQVTSLQAAGRIEPPGNTTLMLELHSGQVGGWLSDLNMAVGGES